MAEFIFKDLVKKSGRENEFYVSSAATSCEELGNPVHYGTKRILNSLGIDCSAKRAVRMAKEDYNRFDLLIVMDSNNLRNTLRITGGDPDAKIHKLMDYVSGGDVADPWYTGDFDATYNDILAGCSALLSSIK